MNVLCTVKIAKPIGEVREMEATNPDLMAQLQELAGRHMTAHRRLARGDLVMDLDEYESAAAYHAFLEEAEGVIAQYGRLLGVRPEDTLWEIVDGGERPPAPS